MTPDAESREWTAAEEEILQATYRALLEYGYSELSISRIADELGKTKASLYYHYDSKEDLMVAFLAYALDQFEAMIRMETGDDPYEDLEHVIEKLTPLQPNEEQLRVESVLVALRGQAVSNERFRDQFVEIDDRLTATVREILERGIESGAFRDVDPIQMAEHLLVTFNGAMYIRTTTDGEPSTAAARDSLMSLLDNEIQSRK